MKASELRIGNWVNDPIHNKCNFQIEMFLGIDYFQPLTIDPDEELTLKISECEPIPLTEEWLLKFGFENGNYFILNDVIIYKDYNDKYRYEYNYGQLWVKHVHQLQNLYFALTGEELTLNN